MTPASYKVLLTQNFPLPWLTVVGMLIFFAVFLGVVLWVHRKGSRELYTAIARLPVEEGKR